MAKATKTTTKRASPKVPFKGNEGVRFSKNKQPTPEAKKKGWRELRAERHLSQAIIKEMLGEDGKYTDSFKSYIKSLVTNAKAGNAKAIEAVNKFIEDDIQKVAFTDEEGKAIDRTINLSNGEKVNLS